MPADGFSFTVFIGSEPYHLGLRGCLAKVVNNLFLIDGNLVSGDKGTRVNTEILLLQIAYVPETRHHFVVFPQELFYGFGLGGRLYYHQIFLHNFKVLSKIRRKSRQKNPIRIII